MAKIIRREWTSTRHKEPLTTKGGFYGHALQTRRGVLDNIRLRVSPDPQPVPPWEWRKKGR